MNDDLYDVIEQQFKLLKDKFEGLLLDGFQWSDLVAMFKEVIPAVAVIVNTVPNDLTPEGKKRLFLSLVDRFYTEVLEPLDIPYVPDAIVDKPVGLLIHYAADFAYEWIVDHFQAVGWPSSALTCMKGGAA